MRTLTQRLRCLVRLPYPLYAGGLCALALLALLAGFVPGRKGGELRLPLGLHAPDLKKHLEHAARRPLDTSRWMLRAPIDDMEQEAAAVQAEHAPNALMTFSPDGVSILTAEGPRPLRSGQTEQGGGMDDLFQTMSRKTLGLPTGLNLTAAKTHMGKAAALCIPAPGSDAARAEATRRAWLHRGISPYSAIVDVYAAKFGLDRRLVYAIMYNESGFNPSLISTHDAHGLMQVVPATAGGEVHAYLHGKPGQPERRALLHPDTNIQYGVTYLHLLMRRHMAGVDDPLSREYCAIAAYNIGPGAMMKVFGPTREAAVDAINALSPAEVYTTLLERLPAAETRGFLRKVTMTKTGLMLADAF